MDTGGDRKVVIKMEETNKKGIKISLALVVVLIAAVGVGGFAFGPNQDSVKTLEIQNSSFIPRTTADFGEVNTVRIVNNDSLSHVVNAKNPETGEVSLIADLQAGESKEVTFDTDGIWMIWSPEYSNGTDSEPANQGMVGYVGINVSAPADVFGYYNYYVYRTSEYYERR